MTIETVTAIPVRHNHVLAFEVSKAKLHVHSHPPGSQGIIANDAVAIRRIIRQEIKRNAKLDVGPLLVVCEATGSYDRAVLASAQDLGVACHRAHGSQVRAFAKFRGLKAKTDAIDAPMLADYGCTGQDLRLHTPPPAEQIELRELVERRTELREMAEAERARADHVQVKTVAADIKAHIRQLETRMASLEGRINDLVATTERFAKAAALMRSVKGVGLITAASVLAYLPEIGTLSRGAVAALAGLAPFDDQSGQHDGRRHIAGGRSRLRKSLFMAATVAINCNEHLAAYAKRIRAAGREYKVAVTAVMRKLIVMLNAIVASGEPCRMAAAGRWDDAG